MEKTTVTTETAEPIAEEPEKVEVPKSTDKPGTSPARVPDFEIPPVIEKSAEPTVKPETDKVRTSMPAVVASKETFKDKFLARLGVLRGEANRKRQENVQNRLETIMAYAREQERITNDDVERLTGVGDRQALYDLKRLVKEKKLVRFGKKKNTFYKPVG